MLWVLELHPDYLSCKYYDPYFLRSTFLEGILVIFFMLLLQPMCAGVKLNSEIVLSKTLCKFPQHIRQRWTAADLNFLKL